MKNYTFLKILFAPIVCTFIIMSSRMGIEYYPLSFGLVIGCINWNNHKYGLIIGIVFSLLVCYFSFFVAYFTIYLLGELFNPILGPDTSGVTAILISSFIFAPLLILYLYKFVFNYTKTKISNLIILYSVILLIIVGCCFYFLSDFKIIKFLKIIMLDHYTIWQIIMSFGIQLLIYQKEVFNKKISKK